MFKYRFECLSEDAARQRICQWMECEPYIGESLWGEKYFCEGLHFSSCGKIIKGFYSLESDDNGHRGRPIRANFRGKFVRKNDSVFCETYIYPNVLGYCAIVSAFVLFCLEGRIEGVIIATIFLLIFGKGYCDSMDAASAELKEFFMR